MAIDLVGKRYVLEIDPKLIEFQGVNTQYANLDYDPSTPLRRSSYSSTLKYVPTRYELPHVLNERGLTGTAVEVGVFAGNFSDHILTYWKGNKLFSVDTWDEHLNDCVGDYFERFGLPKGMAHEILLQITMHQLAKPAYMGRSEIIRLESTAAANYLRMHRRNDLLLDCVYLDADHGYKPVLNDCNAWWPLIRPGGILCGDDYGYYPNVIEVKPAVDYFADKHNLEVFVTQFDASPQRPSGNSWMILKP